MAGLSAMNGVFAIHMRCMITASFLASATLALRMPRRRAMDSAHDFRQLGISKKRLRVPPHPQSTTRSVP